MFESPTLFAAFASRLPDPKRKGIEIIPHKYGLTEFDGLELLRRSTGRLPIDTYEFDELDEFDELAVTVRMKGGEMLGYVPRYYSEGVSNRLALGMTCLRGCRD